MIIALVTTRGRVGHPYSHNKKRAVLPPPVTARFNKSFRPEFFSPDGKHSAYLFSSNFNHLTGI
jgi:hypothetical protein